MLYILRCSSYIYYLSKYCKVFQTLNSALAWCEDCLISSERLVEEDLYHHAKAACFSMSTLPDILKTFMGMPDSYDGMDRKFPILTSLPQTALLCGLNIGFNEVCRFSEEVSLPPGHNIYYPGAVSDRFYILAEGDVHISLPKREQEKDASNRMIRDELRSGVIFGEVDFILEQPRQYFADTENGCRLYVLSLTNFRLMAQREPKLFLEFQSMLLKEVALSLSRERWLST